MKIFRPSYDTLTAYMAVCAIVAALVIRDISPSDDALLVWPSVGLLVAAVALFPFLFYLQRKMKRRAENKVRMSDLILPTDIQILAKSNSRLLDDAIALRCAQMEQGRSSGD